MIGCTSLILSRNAFNLFYHVPMRKICRQYTVTINTVYIQIQILVFSSSSGINKILCESANFVPIAVPRFCLGVFFPNVNMLLFNTTAS